MRKVEIQELRVLQMEILDFVAKFCDENQICYWLDSGTLLGAVRHKGYIPWDDDIDIGMLRSDYDKFARLFNEKNGESKFKFECVELNPKFPLPFGKVMNNETIILQAGHQYGINIDVFAFDNAPDNEKKVKRMYDAREFLKFLDMMQRADFRPHGVAVRRAAVYAVRALLRLFPQNYFIRKINKKAKKYMNKETKRVGCFAGEVQMIPCDKAMVASFIEAEFEGKFYKIPVGYDAWLQAFYGPNYMELPPVEQRKQHQFEAYVR